MLDSWTSTCKNVNPDTELAPFRKINSAEIIDIKVKCKTINLVNDNTGEKLGDIQFAGDILDITAKPQSMKEIIDELGFIEIKTSVKYTAQRMRRQATDWDRLFAEYTSNEELHPKRTKNT